MTLSSLLGLLEGGSIRQLRSEIAAPLEAFARGLKERGRAAPITLRDKGTPVLVREVHLANLIKAYVSCELSAVELDYVANVLALSPDAEYSTASVRDVVFALSSPEVNGQLSADRIAALLDELGRGAAA